MISWWVGAQLPGPAEKATIGGGDELRVYTWIFATLLSLYIAEPYLQIYQRSGRLDFPYQALQERAWSNFHIASLASSYVGLLWLLLWSLAALFRLLNIEFISELIAKPLFIAVFTGGATGFGFALGRERERVIASMRGVTLAVLRSLLPLVAGAALLFLVALAAGGLPLLWNSHRPASLLLFWAALLLLLINAAWGDSARTAPTQAWFRRLTEGGILAMLLFTGIAAYGLGVRIQHYSLTPPRIYAVVAAVLLGMHALAYLWSLAERSGPWLGRLPAVNRWLSAVVFAVALLLHTPLFDPLRLSARAQVLRLLRAEVSVEAFDFDYLYHRLGRAGAAQLVRLARLESHPEAAALRRAIAAARQAPAHPAVARPQPAADFERYPDTGDWPADLEPAIRELPLMPDATPGRRDTGLVIAVELDPDAAGPEYVVFSSGNPRVGFALRRSATGWERFADYRGPATGSYAQLRAALAAGGAGPASPLYPRLAIGELRFDPIALARCAIRCEPADDQLLNPDPSAGRESLR